jgi:hypothetical protein
MNSIDMLIEAFRKSLEQHNIKLDVKYIMSQLNHEVIAARDKHKEEIINAILDDQFSNMYPDEYDWQDVKNAIIRAEEYYKNKINNTNK